MAFLEALTAAIELLVFPGLLFIFWFALFYEWVDRKLHAKFQNRYGPLYTGPKGIFQPLADFLKLMSKEDIIPAEVDRTLFTLAPILLLVLPLTAMFLVPTVPILGNGAFAAFEGDIVVIIFILTMISLVKFLAAWGSTNVFGTVGGVRLILQLVGYEIPLAVVLLSAGMITGSLSISNIAQRVAANPLMTIFLIPGLVTAIVCFQAELEKIPFDIPEAEQEIVAGWQTEFSGRRLAFLRLSSDIDLVLASTLVAAVFLGGPYGPVIPVIPVQVSYFIWFFIKAFIILLVISLVRSIFARVRIDQMVKFAWKYLMLISILQVLLIQVMMMAGLV
jgi:NADH-quinone oxidoreductase subunit H